jgi:hypothetical protein
MPTVCASLSMAAPTTPTVKPSSDRVVHSIHWPRLVDREIAADLGEVHRQPEPTVHDEKGEPPIDLLGTCDDRVFQVHAASDRLCRGACLWPRDRQGEAELDDAIIERVTVGQDRLGHGVLTAPASNGRNGLT